jgi:alpha-galactosidase
MKQQGEPVLVIDETQQRMGFRMGGFSYAEELKNGKLVAGAWRFSAPDTDAPEIVRLHFNVPCHAFGLQVDGQDLAWDWQWIAAHRIETGPHPQGVLELRHAKSPVTVRVHTILDGTAFLRRWLEIRNEGSTPCGLSAVEVWSGVLACGREAFPEAEKLKTPYSLGWFAGHNWAREGRFVWEALTNGVARRLAMRGPYGTSGYQCPYFLLRREGPQERYYIVSLAWSGPWQAEVLSDAMLYQILHVRMGLAGPAPLRVLVAGETAVTPAIHIGAVAGDFDACVQATHAHVRRSVVPATPVRHRLPAIECNSWTRAGMHVTEASMLDDIAAAHPLGCRIYMQDAGWYGGSTAKAEERKMAVYPLYMGDWEPGPWFPRGFAPGREALRARGMLFGLWIEPEGVGTRSAVAARHPEWLARKDGQPVPPVAERLNLDLAHPAAAKWLRNELRRIIRDYGVDILRLDGAPMSATVGERVVEGRVENSAWRHVEALYSVLEEISREFPDLLIENCCGGGGRNDWGMMSRTHWAQLSDESRPAETLQILNGMTVFLPPELGLNIIGAMIQGQEIDVGTDTLYRILMLSRLVLLPPRAEPDWDRKTRHYLTLYNEFIASLLPTCRVFHHTPVIRLEGEEPAKVCIIEYAAPDASRAAVWAFQFADGRRRATVWPRGLEPTCRYRVTTDNAGVTSEQRGADLNSQGIEVELAGVLGSEWIRIEVVG